MPSELVKRLREHGQPNRLSLEAADRIEELEGALREIVFRLESAAKEGWPTGHAAALHALQDAHAALNPKGAKSER